MFERTTLDFECTNNGQKTSFVVRAVSLFLRERILERMTEDVDADFSIKQLKASLKANLQKSGVLSTVKAQIRQEFINGLSSKSRNPGPKLGDLDLNDRLIFSCVFEWFNNRSLVNTISVFLAETGLDPKKSILQNREIVQLIKFNEISSVLNAIRRKKSLNQLDNNLVDARMTEQDKTTVLDLMVRFCTSSQDLKKEIATQTEHGGQSAREALEESIRELRGSFLSAQRAGPTAEGTIQERMIAFQRDCERRVQSDVALQVAHIRETELTKVRLEEASKARLEMDALRKRLESDYARRLQAVVEGEATLTKKLADQELSAQRGLYEARQQMQREIDDLRGREAAAARKLELEAQGVRMLELRLKESLSAIEAREADVVRRERAMEERRSAGLAEARREAQEQVQAQLEILARERSALLTEQQSFLDQRAAHSALVEGAKGLREQLRQVSEELVAREEELAALRRHSQRVELQRQEEESTVRRMMEQLDPSLVRGSALEQVVALIKQNAALETRLASYADAHSLQQRLDQEQQERRKAQEEVVRLRSQVEEGRQALDAEREATERAVAAEKARGAASAVKVEELRQLLRDKTLALETLSKQLLLGSDSAPRHQNRVGSSVSSGTLRARGGSSDRKARHLLRASGRLSDDEEVDVIPGGRYQAQGGADATAASLLEQVLRRLQSPAPGMPALHSSVPSGPAAPAPQQVDLADLARREEERRQNAVLLESLQRERESAAALSAEVERQKITAERLALQAERAKLEAEERMRQQQAAQAAQLAAAQRFEPVSQLAQQLPQVAGVTAEESVQRTTRPPSGKSSAGASSAGASLPSWSTSAAVRFSPLGSNSSVSSSAGSLTINSEPTPAQHAAAEEEAAAVEQAMPAVGRLRGEMVEVEESPASSVAGGGDAVSDHHTDLSSVGSDDGEGDFPDFAPAAEADKMQTAALEQARIDAEREAAAQKQHQEQAEREAAATAASERERVRAQELAEQQRAERLRQEEEARRVAAQRAEEHAAAEELRAAAERAARVEREKEEAAAAAAAVKEAEAARRAEEDRAAREEEERRAEEQRKADADAAAIMEARARVLARRQQKSRLDQGVLSNSLPSSLQAAAVAHGEEEGDSAAAESSAGASQGYSATSLLRANMHPSGVSMSLDSGAGLRPARNLFGNNQSSRSALDADSSSGSEGGARMEVADVSDDHEGDRSMW